MSAPQELVEGNASRPLETWGLGFLLVALLATASASAQERGGGAEEDARIEADVALLATRDDWIIVNTLVADGKRYEAALRAASQSTDPVLAARALDVLEKIRLARTRFVLDRSVQAVGACASAVAWSSDGRWIAGAGTNGTVVVLESKTGDVRARLTETHPARYLAFSPSGNRLWVAGGTLHVWDLPTRTRVASIAPVDHAAVDGGLSSYLQASADGSRILVQGGEGMSIWDGESVSRLLDLPEASEGGPSVDCCPQLSPDGGTVAVGFRVDGAFDAKGFRFVDVSALDLGQPAEPVTERRLEVRWFGAELRGREEGAGRHLVSPDGARQVCVGAAGPVRVLDAAGAEAQSVDLDGALSTDAAWGPRGGIAIASDDGTLRVVDAAGARRFAIGGAMRPRACCLSRDGDVLAARDDSGCVALIACGTGEARAPSFISCLGEPAPAGGPDFLVLQADGVHRVDGRTGRRTAHVWKIQAERWCPAPDGSRAAFVLADETCWLLMADGTRKELTWPGSGSPASYARRHSMAWSPTGRHLAIGRLDGSQDPTLMILDRDGASVCLARTEHENVYVERVGWSPDGQEAFFGWSGAGVALDVRTGVARAPRGDTSRTWLHLPGDLILSDGTDGIDISGSVEGTTWQVRLERPKDALEGPEGETNAGWWCDRQSSFVVTWADRLVLVSRVQSAP
jgi:WD40 repeat protein